MPKKNTRWNKHENGTNTKKKYKKHNSIKRLHKFKESKDLENQKTSKSKDAKIQKTKKDKLSAQISLSALAD